MKNKPIFAWTYVLILFFLFVISGCSTDQDGKSKGKSFSNDDYFQFKSVDLSPFGLLATIMIPDETAKIGASYKVTVENIDDFKWRVSAGPHFELYLEDWGENQEKLERFRASLKEDEIFLRTILTDKKNCVLYKQEVKKTIQNESQKHESFHVFGFIKLGNIYYEIRNKPEGDSKKTALLMMKSIHSFKQK